VVGPQRVTIREKINLITSYLRLNKSASFRSLLSTDHSRLEIVVTFLAVLELIKRHLIEVSQEGLFGDIAIQVSESWQTDQEIETEFE
jgi:segregation and condensation protein A